MVLPATSSTIRRLLDTVTAMPWNALKSVEETLLWSLPPEPTGPKWADDVFTMTKTLSVPMLLAVLSHDDGEDLTDSCSSGSSEDDELVEWSSDEGSLDDTWMDDEASVAYEGERWYWSPPNSIRSDVCQLQEASYETTSQHSAEFEELELEPRSEHYRRPTMYAMPTMDFGAVDSWVDRYGSSKEDFAYVATLHDCDLSEAFRPLPPSANGFYIPKL